MGFEACLASAALDGRRTGTAAASAGFVGASCLGFGLVAGFAISHPLGRAACPGRSGSAVWSGLPQRARGSGQPSLAGPTEGRIGGQFARSPNTGFALGVCRPLSGLGGCGLGTAPAGCALCAAAGGGSCPYLARAWPSSDRTTTCTRRFTSRPATQSNQST